MSLTLSQTHAGRRLRVTTTGTNINSAELIKLYTGSGGSTTPWGAGTYFEIYNAGGPGNQPIDIAPQSDVHIYQGSGTLRILAGQYARILKTDTNVFETSEWDMFVIDEPSSFVFQVGATPDPEHLHHAFMSPGQAKFLVHNTDPLQPVAGGSQPSVNITTEIAGASSHQHTITVFYDYVNHTFVVTNITNNVLDNHEAWLIGDGAGAGAASVGDNTEIQLSDGAGGFVAGEVYVVPSPDTGSSGVVMTLGKYNTGDEGSKSTITSVQVGEVGVNNLYGGSLVLQASSAAFISDAPATNIRGGNVTIFGGNGGQVGTPDRDGAGGGVDIIAGEGQNFPGGIINITAGDGTLTTGGNVNITAGISADLSNSDGNVTVSVGQTGGTGAHFKIRTNDVERLRIGSQGAWNIGGTGGATGQVITSNGPGTPPTWEDTSPTLNTHTFLTNGLTNPAFNGTVFSNWAGIIEAHVAPPNPYQQPSIDYSTAIETITAGFYRVTVTVELVTQATTLPEGMMSYGTRLNLSNGSLTLNGASIHTAYGTVAGYTALGSAGFTAGDAQTTLRWTDTYVVSVNGGNLTTPEVFAYNGTTPTDTYSAAIMVQMEYLAPPSP